MMMKKLLSLLLAVALVLSLSCACAEEAELTGETVVAKVNGKEITWNDCARYYDNLVAQYGSYYDLSDESNVKLFRAVAMDEVVTETLLYQKAEELGMSELTEDEKNDCIAQAGEDWDAAIAAYMQEAGCDEATAVAYYEEQGTTKEAVEQTYLKNGVYDHVYSYFTQSAVVTDDDVNAYYDSLVASDKELYENDLEGYVSAVSSAEMMAYYYYMYYGTYEVTLPYYKPAGFRSVTHILLSVDEELLNNYNDLVARFEEQQSAEEAAAEENADAAAEENTEAAAEEPAEPVTEEMISEAEAAILASRADDIQAIYDRYEGGEDFEALIDAFESTDGHNTYEICEYSTASYVAPFVNAAMSIPSVGELSQPAVSQYGIHIVQYLGDVEGGPVALSDQEFESIRADLLSEQQQNLYYAALEEYRAASGIEYFIPTVDELDVQ